MSDGGHDETHRATVARARAGDAESRRDLVRRAARGDELAIAALPTVYYERVLAMVLACRLRAGEAEEITQEAFLRTTQACRAGLPELQMPAFTCTIARNLVRDLARRRREASLDAMEGAPELVGADLPDGRHDAKDLVRLYTEVLGLLPSRNQAVIRRWLELDSSVSELAEALGMTEPAVKNVVLRFRIALRTRLVGEGFSVP